MSTAGEIIYKAFSPTLKMMLTITSGYIITKIGMFTPPSAKGVSLLVINVSLPALMFSSIVTAFSPSNISAFGSLAIMAVLYIIIGGGLSFVIREIMYCPVDFQWGIIVMGSSSNWGNLPIAMIQTLGLSDPFNGASDVALGVAYDAIFVLFTNTTFFPLGLHKLCALDFKEENLKREILPIKQRWSERWRRLRHKKRSEDEEEDVSEKSYRQDDIQSPPSDRTLAAPENVSPTGDRSDSNAKPAPKKETSSAEATSAVIDSDDEDEGDEQIGELQLRQRNVRYATLGAPINRKSSRHSSFTSMLESTRPIPPTAPLDATDIGTVCRPVASCGSANGDNALLPVCSNHGGEPAYHEPATPAPSIHKPSWHQRFISLVKVFLLPNTVAIVVALPCAIILPLKALFVKTPGWTGGRMPNAPDGNPPLHFILETASFIGALAVPASLLLLGASMARLKAPKDWRELPLLSIISMMLMKMVLLPVFGIFVVQALRDHTNLFPREDKMRTFVTLLCSGTPTAINQLVVTQLYNPAGSAETLSMYIALQYLLMPVLNTALAAISLYVVKQ